MILAQPKEFLAAKKARLDHHEYWDMRWVALGGLLVALVALLSAVRIEHGSGRVLFTAHVEVSSPSGSQSGVVVELVHRFGGKLGFPRIKRTRVCVTNAEGVCEGRVDYRFDSNRIRLIRSWPTSTWQLELFADGRRVATHELTRDDLAGAMYNLKVQIP